MRRKAKALISSLAVLVLLLSGSYAFAALKSVGPVSQSTGFFPAWYMDNTGEVLDLCLPSPGAELEGGYCLLLPPDIPNPAAPISFPDNFPEEAFWWSAGASIDLPGGGSADLVLALEAAFGGGPPKAGDQVSFGRVRIRIDTPFPGTYRVIHPFGEHTFTVTEAEVGTRAINFTEDIGIGAPGDFRGALGSSIGPFLRASETPGGAPLPYHTNPAIPGKFYLADPGVPTNVTGGVNNVFRVEGPADFGAVETIAFDLQGRVFNGTPVSIERSTYSRTESTLQVDAFADSVAGASLTVGLPGSPQAAMAGSAEKYYGNFSAASLPPAVAVTAQQPGKQSTTVENALSDVVTITQAVYNSATGGLSVSAGSSDADVSTLTVDNLGPVPNGGVAVFTLPIPPAAVTVTSGQGGSDTEAVVVIAGEPGNVPPAAAADAYGTLANTTLDVPAPGVLGNDTDPDGDTPLTAVLVVPPANGSLTLRSDGSFSYIPNLNFAGTDSFTYNARDTGGALSPPATVTITVTAVVNTPPTAANDSYTIGANSSLAVPAPGVLGNDSDPDGNLPLSAFLETGVVNGTLTFNANGSFSYTPASGFSGTDSFTYRAVDVLGASSAAAATVSIAVNAPESIAITRAEYRTTTGEWRVEGTSAPVGVGTGNTITVYLGSTAGGTIVGTATVLPDGTWILRQTGINPGTVRTVSARSSSGATALGFTLRIRF